MRNLLQGKMGWLPNVLGLALGLAAFLFLALFVRSELSFDRYNEKLDRIYRISQGVQPVGQPMIYTVTNALPLGPTLRHDFPEVAETARVLPCFEGGGIPCKVAVRYGREKQFYEWFAWADDGLFRILTVPFVAGDPATALKRPNTAVVSESAARRYFGGAPALGKRLKIDSGYSDEDYEVTGVFRDFPYGSHVHFDVLVSYVSLDHVDDPRILRDVWSVCDTYTYVLLAKGVPPARVDAKFPAFVAKYFGDMGGEKDTLQLQPLADVHLHSHQLGEFEANGDVGRVRLAAIAAGVTLLVVCLNFMVLSAAGFAGVAAPAKGGRGPMFRRFFVDSLRTAGAGAALAVVLVAVALPAFDSFAGGRVELPGALSALLALAALVLLLAAAAAGYAAAVLGGGGGVPWFSRAADWQRRRRAHEGGEQGKPGHAPTGAVAGGNGRKVLVAAELALAAALLIAAGVLHHHLRLLRNGNLGFSLDRVLVIPIRDVGLRNNFLALKAAMARHPDVVATTFSSLVLGKPTPQIGTLFQGVKGQKDVGTLVIDHDFLKVFDIALAAGRPLSRDQPSDAAAGFLINEAAVELWGLRSPREAIGKRLLWNGMKRGTVVGVVRNFRHRPLQPAVEPLLLHIRPLGFRYLYAKLAPRDTAGAVRHAAALWRSMVPDKPFESFFLADEYDRAYRDDEHLQQVVGLAALLALVAAALGLLGTAALAGVAGGGEEGRPA
jgi:putative ABC transport system permease protein